MKQGTHEWFMARCGRVTTSRVADVMDFLKKGGEGAKRRGYRAEIVAEILTGQPNLDGFLTPAMMHGNDFEELARATYSVAAGVEVDLEGFVVHPTIARAGASPDGLIGQDGGVELKCPKTETHLRYLLSEEVPEEYQPQMFFGMACTGRQWWDFASYDPRLPEPLQLFRKRLYRDPLRIAEIEDEVIKFLGEVDATVTALRAQFGDFPLPGDEVLVAEADPLASTYLTDEDFAGLV